MPDSVPNELGFPKSPAPALSHLDREAWIQRSTTLVRSIHTDDLRLLRAWLLDVVQKGLSSYVEIATIKGEAVHAEIARREQSLLARLLRPTVRSSLRDMASFADLAAPKTLS